MTHWGNIGALKWTPEQDALLTHHARAGLLPYSKIAPEINQTFHTSFTRNACIGRAKRLGLLISNPRANGSHLGMKTRRERKDRIRPPTAFKPPQAVARASWDDFVPRNVAFLDLQPDDCRWPYGDNIPYFYCGHPKVVGSYCLEHFYLSMRVRS